MTGKALALNATQQRLLEDYQRDLPLTPRPFATIGRELGISEEEVLQELQLLTKAGLVSRVGPVFAPNRLGCSTLAALAVAAEELESVASLVSSYEEVNHNYERDHYFNLWFVITAPDRKSIDDVLADIAEHTGLEPLDLPMIEDFFIDLGFSLWT